MTERSKEIFADGVKLRQKLGIYLQTPEKVEIYAQAAEKMFAKTGGTGIGYVITWSWWAFFGSWGFFLYRKCYFATAIFFILPFLPMIPLLLIIIICAVLAKYQVIKNFERKLDLEDDAQLATGVNKWAIYLIIALILIFSLLIFFANYEEMLMLSDDPLEIFNMRRF